MDVLKKITLRNAPFMVLAAGSFMVAAYLMGMLFLLVSRALSSPGSISPIGIGVLIVLVQLYAFGAVMMNVWGIIVVMLSRGVSSLSRRHYALRVTPAALLSAGVWLLVFLDQLVWGGLK
jgi:hypothetical protein